MAIRFETEELDEQTLHYLRTARELEGEGMPGIYLDASSAGLNAWLPGCGAICGAVLFFIMLAISWRSTTDPINMALLQTAGFGLSAWLVLAWFRTLIWRATSDYVGYFKFVDPLYIWHASGKGVWVTPIQNLRSAFVEHNHNNEGNYTGSTILIRVGDEKVYLALKSMGQAEQVTAYLEAVAEMANLSPLDRGYQAKSIADLDEDEMRDRVESLIRGEVLPANDRRRRRTEEHREVEEIPEPHKVGTSIAWLWRYPAIVFAAVVMFFVFKALGGYTRDDAMYAEVKDKGPPEWRAYLIDQRNKRHRADIQKKLDARHEQAAQRIRQSGGGDINLKNGIGDIVDALKKTTTPIITIGFKGKHEAAPAHLAAFSADRLKVRHKDSSKKIAEHLLTVIGDDLALYADAAEGTVPNIEIGYDIKPYNQFGQIGYETKWKVTLRGEPPGGKNWVFETDTRREMAGFNPDAALVQLHNYLVSEIKSKVVSNPFMQPGLPGRPPGFPPGFPPGPVGAPRPPGFPPGPAQPGRPPGFPPQGAPFK